MFELQVKRDDHKYLKFSEASQDLYSFGVGHLITSFADVIDSDLGDLSIGVILFFSEILISLELNCSLRDL